MIMIAGMSNVRKDEESDWRAVEARDPRADGRFVFAVRTTRVFCRPSCPARRPLRRNVLFFPTAGAATSAGYRPCRRCQPEGPGSTAREADALLRTCRRLDDPSTTRPGLAALAQNVGMSPAALRRLFQRELGMTPRAYAEARRLGAFRNHLRKGERVSLATYAAGYGSSSRVYERSGDRLGMTPAEYRRGGKGLLVRYTTAASRLGRVLVGETDRGVCSVILGDTDAEVESRLREEYPAADLRRERGARSAGLEAVLGEIDGAPGGIKVPLDLQATAFYWRVWNALRAIPSGETRSYGEVAKAIGQPGAARAVARACASNPVALLIPCHRVVRAGGEPGGYRWGAERKAQLLEAERVVGKSASGD